MTPTKFVFVTFCILASLSGIFSKTFTVGDDINWTVNPKYNYTDWAKNTSAQVGDSLLFKYNATHHDVWRVSHEQYEGCDQINFIESWASGNDTIFLNSTGIWYFLCSKPQHCTLGQKFSITVPTTTNNNTIVPSAGTTSLLPSQAMLVALNLIGLSFVFSL